MLALRPALALVLLAVSAVLSPPSPATAREFVGWLVRPATLPFAWRGLLEATEGGNAGEVFARGQRITQLLPRWTDGHGAFAYRYALTREAGADDQTAAAERRLFVALAWLDQARSDAGRRELDVLQMQAALPDVACHRFPGLRERLAARGGAAGLADAYLAEAERLFPSAPVREQRTFHAPRLAAAMLRNDDLTGAVAVLETAIARAAEVRDRELATEWAARLAEVVRRLRGDRTVDLTAVEADPRMVLLLPYLR